MNGLGVYVHFPWCLAKCPYCDFLSVAVPAGEGTNPPSAEQARQWIPHERYGKAVIAELEARLPHLKRPLPPLVSVFFGGGTPSLWDPDVVARVLRQILDLLEDGDTEIEITLECNPTSLDERHAERLIQAGINRVSIGVQNLDSERLRFLGRLHDEEGGLRAVRDAVRAGVPRVSADLIYGIHEQGPDAAVEDVSRVLQTGVTHLSAYTLTIEPGTRFGALAARGKLPILDDELVAKSYEAVSSYLKSHGFRHYEVSNFAPSGNESVHNMGYWQGRDYLGLGTGAFGTVTLESDRVRYKNLLSPDRYMDIWEATRTRSPFSEHLSEREVISPDVAHQEALLLGLRTADGVDLDEVSAIRGGDPLTPERKASIARLATTGRLEVEGSRLRIPRRHWLISDGIIRDLL